MEGPRAPFPCPGTSDHRPVLPAPSAFSGQHGVFPPSPFGASPDGSRMLPPSGVPTLPGFSAGPGPDMTVRPPSFPGGPSLPNQMGTSGPATIGTPTPPMGSVLGPPPASGFDSQGPGRGMSMHMGFPDGNATSNGGIAMPGGNLGPPSLGFPTSLPVLDSKGDMWLEHKASDGRTYYSNIRTHETSWECPENAVPVNGSFGLPPGPPPVNVPPGVPHFGVMQRPPLGMPPGGPGFAPFQQSTHSMPTQGTLGNLNGPHPGAPPDLGVAGQLKMTGGQEHSLVRPQQLGGNSDGDKQPSGDQTAPVGNQSTSATGPPANHVPGVGMAPPLQGSNPFFNRLPVPFMPQVPIPGSLPVPMTVPPPPLAQARVWSEHKHPDGRTYFFNRLTGQSVWQRPSDFEAVAPVFSTPGVPPPAVPAVAVGGATESENIDAAVDKKVDKKSDKNDNGEDLSETAQKKDKSRDGPEEDGEEVDEEKQADKDEATSSKPVATKPVPGHAPWVVVFTNDDRVFFYNQSSQQSLWTVPEELADVQNLEQLMKIPKQSVKEESTQHQADQKEMDDQKASTTDGGDAEPPSKRHLGMRGDLLFSAEGLTLSAEKQAHLLKEELSLEERQHLFRQMLLDRQVSAFSTWEKELHKIVFDPRYLLLNVKERRQAFDQFLRTRVEEERRERRDRLKEAKQEFHTLLEEYVTVKTTFSEFAMKNSRDLRFKVIEKMRERETIFNEYIAELHAHQKEKHRLHKEKNVKKFVEMLSENTDLTAESRWSKVKGQFQSDSRYRGVHHSQQREELFYEYISSLNEDGKKKDQEKHEKQERVEASLRERARQVEIERSEVARELMIERVHHYREEALQNFNALLADLVKVPEVNWSPARSLLKKDPRWKSVKLLDDEEKEKLFYNHVNELARHKQAQFHNLINEVPGLTLVSTWKDIKKYIRSDPRYEKFGNSDSRRKEEFSEYMRERVLSAKENFLCLLRETRQITHKSKVLCSDSDQHRKEIIDFLKNDRRYLALNCLPDERDELFDRHLAELEARGPPPPPTANEPPDSLTLKRREQEGRL